MKARQLLIESATALTESIQPKDMVAGTTLVFTSGRLQGNPCKFIQTLPAGDVKVKMGSVFIDGIKTSELGVATGLN